MNVEHTNPIVSKVKKKLIRINVELRNSIDMRWAIARRPEWIQWMQYRKFFLHFYPRPNKKQNKHKQQSWPMGPPQTTKKHNSRAGPQGRSKQKTTKTQASELAHRAALNKKKETQQQSWSTRPPQSIIIVIVVVVAVEIVIILVINSKNKRISSNNEW